MSWNITNAVIFMCAREQNGRIPGFLDNYTIGSVPHGSGLQNLDFKTFLGSTANS
jgi:hypothetical protein